MGYVVCIGKIENHMQIFDQKSRREVSLGGLHIWSDNINMDV